jgi:GTP-binding protein
MQIKTADFVISAAKTKQIPKRPIPHFVFAGRSNVGKSSLLNKILNRKALAKISATPGKTRLLNFFLINDQFYFVDIPGYGYAKVSKSMREDWAKLIEEYLSESPYIATIFQLIDIRHDPHPSDIELLEWLGYLKLPHRIVLTKADKLSKNQVAKQISVNSKVLGIPREYFIATSVTSGLGIPQIRSAIKNDYDEAWERIKAMKDEP